MMTTEDIVNLCAIEEILDCYALDTDTEYTMKPKISIEKAEKMFREHPIRKAYFDVRSREESLATNVTIESTKEELEKFKFIKIE
jgi:hypothetical protein